MNAWEGIEAVDGIERLIGLIERRFDVPVGLLDSNGEPVILGEPGVRAAAPVCEMVRGKKAGRDSCVEMGGLLMDLVRDRSRARAEQGTVEFSCHLGLRVTAAPILVEGEPAGAVYAHGYLAEAAPGIEEQRSNAERRIARFDLSKRRVRRFTSGLPILSAEGLVFLRDLLMLTAREAEDQLRGSAALGKKRRRRVPRSYYASGGAAALIGKTSSMKAVRRRVRELCKGDYPVLVTGESGTGKELVARAIHLGSGRRERPFLVHGRAGFEDGAMRLYPFGLTQDAAGRLVVMDQGTVARARGGTVFVEEVADLSPAAQSGLLRLLEEETVTPAGSSRKVAAAVRVVAATRLDLSSLVSRRAFRRDLFLRLNVGSVHLPPLRERLDDLPVLAERFLSRRYPRLELHERMTPGLFHNMRAYYWPGNVRELENELERLAVLSGDADEVNEELLSAHIRDTRYESRPSMQEEVLSLQRRMILAALARHDGNRTRAAKDLCVSRRNLIRKIEILGLDG